MFRIKSLIAKIALFALLFNLVPFGINNSAYAVDSDGTSNLNLSLTINEDSSENTVILGQDFSVNFTLDNPESSEDHAYEIGYVVQVPEGLEITSSTLGEPSYSVARDDNSTIYVFESTKFLIKGTIGAENSISLSGIAGVGESKLVKVLGYANDNVYGRGPVPEGAPVGTRPGGVDISGGGDDPEITFPSDITNNSDISGLSFENISLSNIPFEVKKYSGGERKVNQTNHEKLVGETYTTTLQIEGNSQGPLKHFHLQDIIPKNMEFIEFVDTTGVGNVDIIYNHPNAGEVTLDLTDITVPTNGKIQIKYNTRITTNDILSYSGSELILDADNHTYEADIFQNVLKTHDGTLAVATGSYQQPTWNDGNSDIVLDSSTFPGDRVENSIARFMEISKSNNRPLSEKGDTITYTITTSLAKNINVSGSGAGTFIVDQLPDGMTYIGTTSSTIVSGNGTAYEFVSSVVDANGDTWITWEIPEGSEQEHDAVARIIYDVLVDGEFEGEGTNQFENTKDLVNYAGVNYTISDSGVSERWGSTDPDIIGDFVEYSFSGNRALSATVAPIPSMETNLVGITTPSGFDYDNTNYDPSAVIPVGSTLEFVVSMDFPNVEFNEAFVANALPLLAGPMTEVYGIQFQTDTGLKDLFGNDVKVNINDKSLGTPTPMFTNNDGTLLVTGDKVDDNPWITTTLPNQINFELGSGEGNKTFAIRFKVDILPKVPENNDGGLAPLKNVTIGNFDNENNVSLATDDFNYSFQVNVPSLILEKTTDASNVEGGTEVEYEIVIENEGKVEGYAENILDIIPDNMTLDSFDIRYEGASSQIQNSSITQSGTELEIIINRHQTNIEKSIINFDDEGTAGINEGKTLVSYTLIPTPNFVIEQGDLRENNITLDYYSLPDAESAVENNYGPLDASASFTVAGPTLVREVVSTSEVDSLGILNLLSGEEIVYKNTITLPGGTYENARFLENSIDGGFLFLTGSVQSASGSLSFENGLDNSSMIGPDWNNAFGDIVNSDTDESTLETIVIFTTYRAIGTSNQNSSRRAGQFFSTGNAKTVFSFNNIRVPNILINKQVNPSSADGGDELNYTITTTNTSSDAPAYDLRLMDFMPSGVSYVPNSLVLGDYSGTDADLFSGSGLILNKLDKSEAKQISFRGTVSNSLAAGSKQRNNTSISYDSLDGDSEFEAEFSGSSFVDVDIKDLDITHELISTDLGSTGTDKFNNSIDDLTIGEKAGFRTTIDLSQASYSGATISVNIPTGFKFTSGVVETNTSNDSDAPTITINPDNTITFDFGLIDNTLDGAQITLLTEGYITSTGSLAGQTKTSTATAGFNSLTKSNSDTYEIVEPGINMTKVYSPDSGDGGDQITTTITITNNGTSPAYDLELTDNLPNNTSGDGSYSSSRSISVVAPGETVTYSYNTILGSGVTSGDTLTGDAELDYTSYPGTPAEGEKSYNTTASDNITVTGDISGLSVTLESPSTATIGDVSSYKIRVPIPEGTTDSLVISDFLPTGMTIDESSINITNVGNISYTGSINTSISIPENNVSGNDTQLITWTVPTIVNSDVNNGISEFIEFTFDTIVLNNSNNNLGDSKTQLVTTNYNNGGSSESEVSPILTITEPSVSIELTNDYVNEKEFNYIFTVTNTGSSNAYELDIESLLPDGISYSGSFVVTNQGGANNLSQSGDNFTIDSLIPNSGNPLVFTIAAIIDEEIPVESDLNNTVNIEYTNQNGNYSSVSTNSSNTERNSTGGINDYSDSSESSIEVDRALMEEDISVVDLNGGDSVISDEFEYTVQIVNTGTRDLSGVQTTIDIPAGFTGFTLVSIPGGSTPLFSNTGGVNDSGYLDISDINIAVDGTGAIVYRVTALPDISAGTNINTVANVSDSTEGALGSSPDVDIVINAPELFTILTSNGPRNTGGIVENKLILENTGTSSGSQVEFVIQLGTGSVFNSGSLVFSENSNVNTGSIIIDYENNTIAFSINSIAPGTKEEIDFEFELIGGEGEQIITEIDINVAEGLTTNIVSEPITIQNRKIGGGSTSPTYASKSSEGTRSSDYGNQAIKQERTSYKQKELSAYQKRQLEKKNEVVYLNPELAGKKYDSPNKDSSLIERFKKFSKKPETNNDISEEELELNSAPEEPKKKKEETKETKLDKDMLEKTLEQLKDDYRKIMEKLAMLDIYNDMENQKGKSIITKPKLLPQTGTPINQRVATKKIASIDTKLPNDISKLAGNYVNDIDFWKKGVDLQDRDRGSYIVIPSNGLVVPINDISDTSRDFSELISGREIDVNKYLKDGVLSYPGSSTNGFGEVGNKVVFGHSSYFKKDNGRYKTHFQKIIELDAGEEVWVYEKQASGEYKRYRYEVNKSYNTPANDVSVLNPGVGSNLTLFTCTPIGGIAGRWIISAKYINEDKIALEKELEFLQADVKYVRALNNLFNKLDQKGEKDKKIYLLKIYARLIERQDLVKGTRAEDLIKYIKYRVMLEVID